jgi:multiple sugar transport system substrate-binding protein
LIGAGFSAWAAEKTKVRLSGWVSSPAEQKILEGSIADFEKVYPNIDVIYEPIPADYTTKIETMVAAGTTPDVFYWDIFMTPPFVRKGVLLPLGEYMKRTETDPGDFISTLLDAFSYEGNIYGIPKDFNTLALFYNKGMFDRAGLAYPTSDWTWFDLKKAAARLTTPNKSQYGLCLPADIARWLPFAFQNGASFFNEDETEVTINSPAAVMALDYYTSFQLKDEVSVQPSDVGAGWAGDAFGKQKVSMVFEGGWLIPYLRSSFPEVEFSATEMPQGLKGRGNLIFTVAYVIPKTCENSYEAWLLINYLTNLENQRKVLHTGFALPTRRALIADPYLKEHPEVMAILKGASYGRPYKFGLLGGKATDTISTAIQAVFLGKKTPEKALNDATLELNERLRKLLK